jgi:hypothetical protein
MRCFEIASPAARNDTNQSVFARNESDEAILSPARGIASLSLATTWDAACHPEACAELWPRSNVLAPCSPEKSPLFAEFFPFCIRFRLTFTRFRLSWLRRSRKILSSRLLL